MELRAHIIPFIIIIIYSTASAVPNKHHTALTVNKRPCSNKHFCNYDDVDNPPLRNYPEVEDKSSFLYDYDGDADGCHN
ncbi:14835_t:CDS:2 [Gigaspora rosea]|nr:14835_t:CDS:2 [Gigaspora rosea]